jgi:co-chaperonin GroES (HSP10)
MAPLIQSIIDIVDRRLEQMAETRSLVPFKPILDRVLVQEIKHEENRVVAAGADGKEIVQSQHFQKQSDRGVVVAVGDGIAMGGVFLEIPLQLGQVVIMGEYGREQIYLKPEDEFSTDKRLPRYFLMRCADIKGVDLRYVNQAKLAEMPVEANA